MQKILITIFSGFFVGVFVRSFVDFGWSGVLMVFLLGVVLLFLHYTQRQLTEGRIFLLATLLLVGISAGMARMEMADIKRGDLPFENNINQKVTISGVTDEEPDEKEINTKVVIKSSDTKILLTLKPFEKFNYGDEIKILGTLKKPQNFSDSKTDFDYPAYLAKDEIYYEMIYPKVEFVSGGKGSWLKSNLFSLKKSFLKNIGEVIPEPESSLMSGVTIGAKQGIPKTLYDSFKQTGVAHIVVLSGYNISIVADSVVKFFSFLPQSVGFSFGGVSILLFVIMTGAASATVRAAIMALIILLARKTGRMHDTVWLLIIAAFLMVFQNPKILRFDTSFQLSVLATLAIIYLAPYLSNKFTFITKRFQIREIIAGTLAAQVFVTPLLLYTTGTLSVVSLVANLLVVPFIPLTMLLGFTVGLTGYLAGLLSSPFGWISYGLLHYQIFVIENLAKIPFAWIDVGTASLTMVIFLYVIIAVWMYKIKKNGWDKKQV